VTPARRRALAVLCLALAVVVIDNTILAVAFPSIRVGLHTDETGLQWIGSTYGLVLAGLLLPIAVLADRHGRKGVLMLGLVIFGSASAFAAFAGSALTLAIARGAMGVGGACAMPATLSMLGNVFPPDQRGRAIAIWSGVAGGATAIGPLAGGLLLEHFWWGSVFLVNAPVAALTLVLAARWLPRSTDPQSPPVDRGSALRWWGALTALLVAVIEGPRLGWLSPGVLGAAGACVVLFVAFGRREAHSAGPLIEAATRRDPRLRAGAATMAALFFGVIGMEFVLTQWIQGPEHRSALTAGLYFVPTAVASLGFALLNPRGVARFGHGPVAAAGLVAAGLGSVVAAVAVAGGSLGGLVAAGLLVGIGIGAASASGVELIMGSARPERAGSASGVNETLVEAAGALGIAVLGTLLVESGSFVWPLPVVGVVQVAAGIGVWRVLRLKRVTRRE